MSYPNTPGYTPGYKVDGPSRDAANAERSRAATFRDKVMEYFSTELVRFTADEIAGLMNESILSIRPRLSELVSMGRIEDSGARRKNASGHKATVWTRSMTYELDESREALFE